MPLSVSVLALFYVACCGLAGFAARNRRIGFVFALVLALILTPFVVLIALYAFGKPVIAKTVTAKPAALAQKR